MIEDLVFANAWGLAVREGVALLSGRGWRVVELAGFVARERCRSLVSVGMDCPAVRVAHGDERGLV